MQSLKSLILLGAFLVGCANPVVVSRVGRKGHTDIATCLDAVALNASAATRTCTLNEPGGWSTAVFYAEFTHANNGTITHTLTVSPDQGTTDAAPQICTMSSGTCTLSDTGVFTTASLSADDDYSFRADIRGWGTQGGLEILTAHDGSPAAGDIMTLKYVLVDE